MSPESTYKPGPVCTPVHTSQCNISESNSSQEPEGQLGLSKERRSPTKGRKPLMVNNMRLSSDLTRRVLTCTHVHLHRHEHTYVNTYVFLKVNAKIKLKENLACFILKNH